MSYFFFLWQIICKMKTKNTDTHMTPNEMCDRIFELVDENHDGEYVVLRRVSSLIMSVALTTGIS